MPDMILGVILVLSIALIVGPIMMFKPSKKEQILATLRQDAALKSIRVRMVTIPANKSRGLSGAITVYSRSYQPNNDSLLSWSLVKTHLSHEIHFDGAWDWLNTNMQAPVEQQPKLRQFIAQLDPSIVGIEVNHQSVGLWWCERGMTIDQLEAQLIQLATIACDYA